jgi:hypothetical protein
MKKLNGFECWLITEGLNAIRNEWKKDIREVEAQGKNPLMTADYADMVITETIDKIKALTKKQK